MASTASKSKSRASTTDHKRPLPKAQVATIALVVSDRNKATDWYTRTLGLEVIESMDHWVAVGRKGKGGLIHLCQLSEFEPSAPLEPGNSGITLRIPGTDFVSACADLKTNGVAFAEEPTKESWGWYATIRDPDGNELFLMPEV